MYCINKNFICVCVIGKDRVFDLILLYGLGGIEKVKLSEVFFRILNMMLLIIVLIYMCFYLFLLILVEEMKMIIFVLMKNENK